MVTGQRKDKLETNNLNYFKANFADLIHNKIQDLNLIAVNHKTAPVAIREKFAISDTMLPNAYQSLRTYKSLDSFVILSTCNRTEIYFKTTKLEEALKDICSFFKADLNIESKIVSEYSHITNGYNAVKNIFQVASGLDSMVLGEKQVLSQVKFAYSSAQTAHTLDNLLEKLFQKAIQTARQVHEKTDISKNSQSISSVAVDLADKMCGPVKTKSVMVLGAGLMAKLALDHLNFIGGTRETIVLNRSPHRVIEFSEKYKIDRSFPFENVYEVLNDTDVLIMAAGAPHFIIFAEQFKTVRKNSSKPLYIFDISMPRNVDSEFGRLPNIKLFDIDTLQETYNKRINLEDKAFKEAGNIILEGQTGFFRQISDEDVNESVRRLKEKVEKIRTEKLIKLKGNKIQFTMEEVDYITKNIVNSILHEPVINLKGSKNKDKTKLLRELFDL